MARNRPILYKTGGGQLTLTTTGGETAMITRSLFLPDYQASVTLGEGPGALAVVGNPRQYIALGRQQADGRLALWHQTAIGSQVLWTAQEADPGAQRLRVISSEDGKRLSFQYRPEATQPWQQAGEPVDVTDLPQWDRGLRLGLLIQATDGQSATFKDFFLLEEADSVVGRTLAKP